MLGLRDSMIRGDIHNLTSHGARNTIACHEVTSGEIHQVTCHVIPVMKHEQK